MTEQIVLAGVAAAVAILAIVALVRVARRRRTDDSGFGAGGTSKVPIGTSGLARTVVGASGVVYAVGEEWTARSRGGAAIAAGQHVRVVGHDGLTLLVDPEPADPSAGE
jgi:membrane protein implicated in regulation of membrane protease activity